MPFNINEFSREAIRSKKLDEAYRMTGMGNDVARVRGLFLMYLLSEKNLSYQDLKDIDNGTSNLTQNEKEQLLDEFVEEIEKRPLKTKKENDSGLIPHPDAAKNAKEYAKWVHNGVKKIMTDVCPKADNIKTPRDAIAYLENFSMLETYVKDIVQEFGDMWKLPETRGTVVYEMGDEEMGDFAKVEALAMYSVALKGLVLPRFGEKAKAITYPLIKEFIDEVAGKSFKELDAEKLIKMANYVNFMATNAGNFSSDEEKDDPKYTKFLDTGEADFDVNNMKLRSGFSGKMMNVKEAVDEIKVMANPLLSETYNSDNMDYSKLVSADKVNELLDELPDELEYTIDVPEEEREKVRDVYKNTACSMYAYYSNAVNASKGAKPEDLLTVDGKSIAAIVDDKYHDKGLTPEQRKAAIEYEFVSALKDDTVSVEYNPYILEPATCEVIKGQPIKVTQMGKAIDYTYDDSINNLLKNNAEIKSGKHLFKLISDAENMYHKLYNDSNRLTDSTEFKQMLGSFKEIHEVYQSMNDTGLLDENMSDDLFNTLEERNNYTKDMFSNLLKETAKNCNDYINAKNASGKYRSTDKGNDRLMCASGFLNDIDGRLTRKTLKDIKLKDARGKKVVKEATTDKSKVRVSFKDLMKEGENERTHVQKKADKDVRVNKKRMHQRIDGREM